jgi:hypothetical protein
LPLEQNTLPLLIDAMISRATHVRTGVARACPTSGKSDNHDGD